MRVFSIFLFLMLCFVATAQNFELKGRIIDEKTKQALPYSTVEIFSQKTGTIADSEGNFILNLKSEMANKDTIRFSHLGYATYSLSMTDFDKLKEKTIALQAKDFVLSEVFVVPKNYKTVKLGIRKKKPERKQITSYYNNKIGNFIENKVGEIGWLKTVSFYIHKTGCPKTPFRVGVYELDKKTKSPGESILNENVIVTAPETGWFSIDMSNFNIQFPKEGFFVVMEWINSGEEYYYDYEINDRDKDGNIVKNVRKFYGQSIGSIVRQPKAITWGINLGNDWIQYKLFHKGYINAMINVDIAYPEN